MEEIVISFCHNYHILSYFYWKLIVAEVPSAPYYLHYTVTGLDPSTHTKCDKLAESQPLLQGNLKAHQVKKKRVIVFTPRDDPKRYETWFEDRSFSGNPQLYKTSCNMDWALETEALVRKYTSKNLKGKRKLGQDGSRKYFMD